MTRLFASRAFRNKVDKMNLAEVEALAIKEWSIRSLKSEANLDYCLSRRAYLLNNMFKPNKQELDRFLFVAELLVEKTALIYRNSQQIYNSLIEQYKRGNYGDFADFNIRATIKVCYNDESSVFCLEDDCGSDYTLFSEILNDYYYGKYGELIAEITACYNNDDATPAEIFLCGVDKSGKVEIDWQESRDQIWLNSMPVCHALHTLYSHLHYSFQDILRINDIWSEVNVTYQNIDIR